MLLTAALSVQDLVLGFLVAAVTYLAAVLIFGMKHTKADLIAFYIVAFLVFVALMAYWFHLFA